MDYFDKLMQENEKALDRIFNPPKGDIVGLISIVMEGKKMETPQKVEDRLKSVIANSPQTPSPIIPTPEEFRKIQKNAIESKYVTVILAQIVKDMMAGKNFSEITSSPDYDKYWNLISNALEKHFRDSGWILKSTKKTGTSGREPQEIKYQYYQFTWTELAPEDEL